MIRIRVPSRALMRVFSRRSDSPSAPKKRLNRSKAIGRIPREGQRTVCALAVNLTTQAGVQVDARSAKVQTISFRPRDDGIIASANHAGTRAMAATKQGRFRVGIGGWTYAPWRNNFYPDD